MSEMPGMSFQHQSLYPSNYHEENKNINENRNNVNSKVSITFSYWVLFTFAKSQNVLVVQSRKKRRKYVQLQAFGTARLERATLHKHAANLQTVRHTSRILSQMGTKKKKFVLVGSRPSTLMIGKKNKKTAHGKRQKKRLHLRCRNEEHENVLRRWKTVQEEVKESLEEVNENLGGGERESGRRWKTVREEKKESLGGGERESGRRGKRVWEEVKESGRRWKTVWEEVKV